MGLAYKVLDSSKGQPHLPADPLGLDIVFFPEHHRKLALPVGSQLCYRVGSKLIADDRPDDVVKFLVIYPYSFPDSFRDLDVRINIPE